MRHYILFELSGRSSSMAEDDFWDGSGEVSLGLTISPPGSKHLFEKNAAILFGPSPGFSDSSTRHS